LGADGKLIKHQNSSTHKSAVHLYTCHVSKKKGILCQLSDQATEEQKNNLKVLQCIASSVKYLAAQGLPLRGHDDENGNFKQLLWLRSDDVPLLKNWLLKDSKYATYTTFQTQNEFLEIFSKQIQNEIVKEVNSKIDYFTSNIRCEINITNIAEFMI